MERSECGAACLAMVLAGFGRWLPPAAVRERCGAARDGTTLAAIVLAARAEGLEADAFTAEVEDVAALPMPQILFWRFDHFVVLEGVARGHFRIVDPALGRMTLTAAEFGRDFTGVTATFCPGAGFKRMARPPGMAWRLAALLRSSPGGVAALLAATLVVIAVGIVVPGVTRVFIDDYLVQQRQTWLVPLLCAMAALGVLRVLATALQSRLLLLLQGKINGMLSAGFVWRMLHLPLEALSRRSIADVASRTQYAGQLAGVASGTLATAVSNMLAIGAYVATMLALDPVLTAAIMPVALLHVALLRWAGRYLRESAQRQQMGASLAHAAAIQGVALLEQYRATGSEDVLFERLMQEQVLALRADQIASRAARLVGVLPFLSGRLLTLVVLGVGALQVVLHRPHAGQPRGIHDAGRTVRRGACGADRGRRCCRHGSGRSGPAG